MNLLCKASDYLRRSQGLANSVTNGADMRLDLERKDVWNMKWADDNPELFAILEKTRHSNTYSARLLQDVRQVIHKITAILCFSSAENSKFLEQFITVSSFCNIENVQYSPETF